MFERTRMDFNRERQQEHLLQEAAAPDDAPPTTEHRDGGGDGDVVERLGKYSGQRASQKRQQSSRDQDPRRFQAFCYWARGTCTRGDSCPFDHDPAKRGVRRKGKDPDGAGDSSGDKASRETRSRPARRSEEGEKPGKTAEDGPAGSDAQRVISPVVKRGLLASSALDIRRACARWATTATSPTTWLLGWLGAIIARRPRAGRRQLACRAALPGAWAPHRLRSRLLGARRRQPPGTRGLRPPLHRRLLRQ